MVSKVKVLAAAISRAFFDLLFPPICLHCNEMATEPKTPLCSACLSQLHLIDPGDRCPHCFHPDYELENCYCANCAASPLNIDRIASAFDYVGAAASLIKKLKYQGAPYLAKGCGAFLAAQLIRLDWPFPDLILPVPISKIKHFSRGYNQSELLAESLSKIINRPVLNGLKRESGGFSQAGLNFQQRKQLEAGQFSYADKNSLQGKVLLLVDDVMTTGSTFRCCGELLMEKNPKAIYGLVFCRAI